MVVAGPGLVERGSKLPRNKEEPHGNPQDWKAIGAEILGVNVKTMDDATVAAIYWTWLDCNVIAVVDQELDVGEFVRYGRRFGHVVTHPSKSTRFPGYPEVTLLDVQDRNGPPVMHPLVRIHAETLRKALYFDVNKLLRIEGLPDAESDALIEALRSYMLQPDAQYRHKWRKGDIVIWDNRSSYHKAAADYPPEQDWIHWRFSIQEPEAVL